MAYTEVNKVLTWKQFLGSLLEAIASSFGWYMFLLPPIIVYFLCSYIASFFNLALTTVLTIAYGSIQFCFFMSSFKEELSAKLNKEFEILRDEKVALEKHKTDIEYAIKNEREELKYKEQKLYKLLQSTTPFRDVAEMRTEVDLIVFNQSIGYLKNKRHHAYKAADEVRSMKRIVEKTLKEAKTMEYKYQYILSAFPEIQEFVENDEDLITVGTHLSYDELEDAYDKRKDFLSKEEYASLTDSQKSQLALDRYVQGQQKNKWQIGRDYEMSCAFQLIMEGYRVEMHGIKYKNEDLGRDIIAQRINPNSSTKEVLIVQCKNWSHNRIIHENVIMQLYGTAIAYELGLNELKGFTSVIPVLMIPEYSQVSYMAFKFAKRLNIRIVVKENLDFPRIKCNINNGEKIYHLPFDQQYDRTEIKLKGEFYAYTVKEAEAAGFRRAKRYSFTN